MCIADEEIIIDGYIWFFEKLLYASYNLNNFWLRANFLGYNKDIHPIFLNQWHDWSHGGGERNLYFYLSFQLSNIVHNSINIRVLEYIGPIYEVWKIWITRGICYIDLELNLFECQWTIFLECFITVLTSSRTSCSHTYKDFYSWMACLKKFHYLFLILLLLLYCFVYTKSILKVMKHNILIELIISHPCNKRCEYCDLEFANKQMGKKELDTMIQFLRNSRDNLNSLHINFFWWEPLLNFAGIQYFLENVGREDIKYSLWTNGMLLTPSILSVLDRYNVEIYISVDNIDGIALLETLDVKNFLHLFQVNYINDPDFLYHSPATLDKICEYWFTRINFMPVLTTKKWSYDQMVALGKLKKYSSTFTGVSFQYYSYYNWFSSQAQFVIDADMVCYQDIDSLIWLQKQYKIIPESLRHTLDRNSRIGVIWKEVISTQDLYEGYDKKQLLDLIMQIPKTLWRAQEYISIDKILKHGNKY